MTKFLNSTLGFLGAICLCSCASLPEGTSGGSLSSTRPPEGVGSETARLEVLAASPMMFQCARNAAVTQILTVRNSGESFLSFVAEASHEAVSLEPESSGLESGEEILIRVQVDCSRLGVGNVLEEITFSAGSASGSPAFVDLQITVGENEELPDLEVISSFEILNCLDNDIFHETIVINNVGGGGNINWTGQVLPEASWLIHGELVGTTPAALSFTVDCTAVDSGSYQTDFVVTASGGEEERVTLGIEESWIGHDPVELPAAHDGSVMTFDTPYYDDIQFNDQGEDLAMGLQLTETTRREHQIFFRFDMSPFDLSEVSSIRLKLNLDRRVVDGGVGSPEDQRQIYLWNLLEDYSVFDEGVLDIETYMPAGGFAADESISEYELEITELVTDGIAAFKLSMVSYQSELDDIFYLISSEANPEQGPRLLIEFQE